MSENWSRFLLKVVRRKHMVFRRNEGLEEPPSPARDETQGPRVSGGDWFVDCPGRRQACPSRDGWRECPQNHERGRNRPRGWLGPHDEEPCSNRDGNTTGHLAVEPTQLQPRTDFCLRGSDPFEQHPMRHE